MKFKLITAIALSSFVLFSGCKNDDDTTEPAPQGGQISLSLAHEVAGQPLVLNTQTYTSPGNQEYTISDFKYYISNIKLYSPDLLPWEEGESYHFVNQLAPESKSIILTNIEPGTYDSLIFAIGIDNNRNHTGAQTGALDPANGMLWDWNTGYKFLQLEGKSPSSPQQNQSLVYHIGRDQNYRLVRIGFAEPIEIREGSFHSAILKVDINRIFGTADAPILFNEVHTVMGLGNSEILANNYSKMFSLEGIFEAVE